MVWSMTGFGEGTSELTGVTLRISIRSVNHRFLDLNLRLPSDWQRYQRQVESRIKARLVRGRADVSLRIEGVLPRSVHIDAETLGLLWTELSTLRSKNSREESADGFLPSQDAIFAALAPQLGTLVRTEAHTTAEETERALEEALITAIDSLCEDLRIEGEKLRRDLLERVEVLQGATKEMEKLARAGIAEHRDRLLNELEEWLPDVVSESNDSRLEQELVSFANRADVAEEIVRLNSHLKQAKVLLASSDTAPKQPAMGRKLDFLVQEMNREANTIGSKSMSTALSHAMVEAKAEIERIREQVQNLA